MILSRRAGIIWLGSAIVLLALLMPLALKAQNAAPPAPAMPAAPIAPAVPSTLPAVPAPAGLPAQPAQPAQPAPVVPTTGTMPPQPAQPSPAMPAAVPAPAAPTAGAMPTGAMQTQNYLAAAQMIAAMQHLHDQGKLTSNKALAASGRSPPVPPLRSSQQQQLPLPFRSRGGLLVHKHQKPSRILSSNPRHQPPTLLPRSSLR